MNAPHTPRPKITSLFSASSAGARTPEEERMALLDLAPNAPEIMQLSDEQREALEEARAMMALGKSLPKPPAPSPAIRATVLQAAHSHHQTAVRSGGRAPEVPGMVPGWRWAWAAILLVCSWGAYLEVSPTALPVSESVQIENELVQLENELQELYADLAWEFDGAESGEGWS